jgi:hypothetical protein
MNERVTAGDGSSFTTADTVGLNRNNLPRPTNRARNIVPPLRRFLNEVLSAME